MHWFLSLTLRRSLNPDILIAVDQRHEIFEFRQVPEANDKEKSVHAVVSWTTELKRIIGTPVAADGGSLALEVERIDEGVEFLVLNRSIAARGTDAFETLSSQRGVLSHDEVFALINVLGQLPVFGENADVGMVENFLAIVKRKYWAR